MQRLGGVAEILREYRPDFDWKEWLLPEVATSFWQSRQARRRYLSWLGEELGYESPRDWCHLDSGHIDRCRGRLLLEMYSFSVDAILQSAFPARHPIVLARRRT